MVQRSMRWGHAFGLAAWLLGVSFVLGLAGCKSGATVTVDISVPKPLIEPIDVAMGVYLDDTLKSYVHQEELEDHGAYQIDIGASQAPVFEQVFEAMFDSVVPVVAAPGEAGSEEEAQRMVFANEDGGAMAVQGILAPTIEEVQFAIPDQTGGEFYEVWIRYRIRLFNDDGSPLAEWPLIGYGKANQRNYGSIDQKGSALSEATIWALRDAAALLSFQFRDQAEVQGWLAAVEGNSP